MVRPWKAPSRARTRGLAGPPWRRAILKAASLASVPELARKALESPEPAEGNTIPPSSSARLTWAGEVKKFEM